MNSASVDAPHSAPVSVSLGGARGAVRQHVLAAFEVGAPAMNAPSVPLPFLWGCGPEVWLVDAPVQRIEDGDVWAVTGGGFLLCEARIIDADPLRERTRRSYERLVDFIGAHGHPHIVKAWHYVPDINRGEGDEEQYKRFCLGRAEALETRGKLDLVPAGTAVGGAAEGPFTVTLVASSAPPLPLENPRQVSAYRYPRRYGPASPSFSRASWVERADGGVLFVSGTASIVGHRSIHPGDVALQAAEIGRNLEALLARHAERTGRRAQVEEGAYRVYVRHEADVPAVQAVLCEIGLPAHRTAFLRADICRRELLVELDAVIPATR